MAITWEYDKATRRGALSGTLDGDDDLGLVFADLSGDVVVDIHGITRITSAGARSWTAAMRCIEGNATLVLERCSVAVVCHLAINPLFRGSAVIRSVEVPHRCPSCDGAEDVEMVLPVPLPIPSVRTCGFCGAQTAPDVDETSYFEGLTSSQEASRTRDQTAGAP